MKTLQYSNSLQECCICSLVKPFDRVRQEAISHALTRIIPSNF